MKYRVPFKMFFDWFVPYSRRGSRVMSVLVPSVLMGAVGQCFPETMLFLGPYAALFSVFLVGYHRKVTLLEGVGVALATGLLSWALGTGRDPDTLYLLLGLSTIGGLFGTLFQTRWLVVRQRVSQRRFDRWRKG